MLRPTLAALSALASLAFAADFHVANSGGNATSPIQYGIMFEDINHSGDGGLYAELLRNRAFQGSSVFPSTIDPWTPIGGAVLSLQGTNSLAAALSLSLNVAASTGIVGISNPGWWGLDVRPQQYVGSFWVYGGYDGAFTVSLHDNHNTYASLDIQSRSVNGAWTQHNFTLTPPAPAPTLNNFFSLTYDASRTGGSLNLNLISLFPPTYHYRPNGMRIELSEDILDLKPSFLRFPGGNNLEGPVSPYHWFWNRTIGPLTDRPSRPGTWGYENTDGLGLAEYLNWCTDMYMEPVLVVWAGLYLDAEIVAEDQLGPYVQDALNELEYIMGGTDTEFGALRASHGYPNPWKVKYVEIGNEGNLNNGLTSYRNYRFPMFYNAIHAAYPDIKLIASTIELPLPAGAAGEYHVYTEPRNLVAQYNFFDQNNSAETQTIIGEYAVTTPDGGGGGTNDGNPNIVAYPFWQGSVAEAVFLLGAERNNILGLAYAPVLQNAQAYNVTPNMITFTANPDQTTLSTSYYTFKLYANNRYINGRPVTTSANLNGPVYFAAGDDIYTGVHTFKMAVYNSGANVPMRVSFDGVSGGTNGYLTVLTSNAGLMAENVPGGPNVVGSSTSTLTADGNGVFAFTLPDYSVAVLTTQGYNITYG